MIGQLFIICLIMFVKSSSVQLEHHLTRCLGNRAPCISIRSISSFTQSCCQGRQREASWEGEEDTRGRGGEEGRGHIHPSHDPQELPPPPSCACALQPTIRASEAAGAGRRPETRSCARTTGGGGATSRHPSIPARHRLKEEEKKKIK